LCTKTIANTFSQTFYFGWSKTLFVPLSDGARFAEVQVLSKLVRFHFFLFFNFSRFEYLVKYSKCTYKFEFLSAHHPLLSKISCSPSIKNVNLF
jgi:hypothetical protein